MDDLELQELTPLMRQYFAIKRDHPEALLFFQVGDFYELFFEDAQRASAVLGIALTARGKNKGEPIPLCGVPVHALEHYLVKLVKAGFKVALCEQLEPPQPGKVVDRGVTRVLTPGTLTESTLLDAKTASYLFSFFPTEDSWGLLFGELLTAQLFATVMPHDAERHLDTELGRFFPDEIIVPSTREGKAIQSFFKQRGYCVSMADENLYGKATKDAAQGWMRQQFNESTCERLSRMPVLEDALSLMYGYLKKNQESALGSFNALTFYDPEDFLSLDPSTQRNLELVANMHDGSRKNTLLEVLDGSSTAMGSRMIKKWLVRPLVKKEPIVMRQDAVGAFVRDQLFLRTVREQLETVGDLERCVGRIMLNRALPYEYGVLGMALGKIPLIREVLLSKPEALLHAIASSLGDFKGLALLLEAAIQNDPAQPGIIKSGFDARLDEMRELVINAHQRIADLERAEQEATGIGSLKIRYNQAHGYSIEITKTHFDSIPERYTRKQTLVGRERFVTPELIALEHEITHARLHIETLEKEVFERVKREVAVYGSSLRKLAHALATLDALVGFATVAGQRSYVRPTIASGRDIAIVDGRHPVVECVSARSFIPNSTLLNDEQSVWIITGPNMGGKSTHLRQVALICLMAQCGSFVPAAQASVPLLDRIFTRIGASDNVAAGKSTFLVEMEETATICSQATAASLVILDEVGRGTSTFDGLALAQAVVEHVHTKIGARCLFATHYHELTQLQEHVPGMVNYFAASKKTDQGLIFLYRIVPGIADGSFGITVARLAQLPKSLIERAEEILASLKRIEQMQGHAVAISAKEQQSEGFRQEAEGWTPAERSDFERLKVVEARLQGVDVNNLTPKAAFDLVWELKVTLEGCE